MSGDTTGSRRSSKKHKSKSSSHHHARQIRSSLSQIRPSNSHPQRQCPLFSILPAELRTLIFDLALSEHDDKSVLPDGCREVIRPGHIWETKVYTDLCSTCRLIYYETSWMPLHNTVLEASVFGPRSANQGLRYEKYELPIHEFTHFTAKQSANLNEVRYDRWLCHYDIRCFAFPQFQPSIISMRLKPLVKIFDQWLQVSPFRTSIFDELHKVDNMDPTKRHRFYQLVPPTLFSMYSKTSKIQGWLPGSLKELRLYVECLHVDRSRLHGFLEEVGPQIGRLANGNVLSTVGHPIIWDSWWILPGDTPTGANGMYEWQQRCQARLVYTLDKDASECLVPPVDWESDQILVERLYGEYLEKAKARHVVRSDTRSAESKESSSYVKWMMVSAAACGTTENLMKKIPAIDAISRDWSAVTSGRFRR